MVQGSLGGANGGGVYEDSEGNRYYVKNVPSGPHAHNEVLASALYQALGVNTTHARIGTNSLGQTFVVTKFVDGAKTDLKKRLDKNDTEWIAKAQQDMAIDALLGNYDVVGPNYTNMVTGPDGEPLRLDHGGALAYRGTGSKKSWWSDTVAELDTLRGIGNSPAPSFGTARKLFGTMTYEDVRNSAKKLLTISPQQITDIVNASGLSDKEKEKMAARLIKRRHDILEKTNLLTPVSDGNTPENASKKLDDALSAAEEGAKVDAPSAPTFSIGDTVHYTGPNNEEIQLTGTIVGQSGPNFSVQSESGKKYLFHYSHIAPGEHPDNAQPVITNSKGTSFKNGDEAWFHDATSGEFLHGTIGEDHIFSPTGMGVLGVDFNTDAGDNWSAAPDDLYTASEHAAIQDLLGNLTPPAATSLGDGYAALPEGAVPMYTFDTPMAKYQKVLVQHPDGKFYMYKPDGSVAQAYKQSLDSYTKNPKWKKWDGEVAPSTPEPSVEFKLPENYPTPPEGAKVLYEHFNEDKSFHAFLVQYPDGTLHAYYPKGSNFASNDIYDITDPTITIDHYKHDPDWTPVGSAPTSTTETTPQPPEEASVGDDSEGPLSANNKTLKVGDKVSSAGSGKKIEGIVVGVLPDNRVKVRYTDENGKQKTALRQAKKWIAKDPALTGLKPGEHPWIIHGEADPTNPLYGTPKPTAPPNPTTEAGPFVTDEWLQKADAHYQQRKIAKGQQAKPLSSSSLYHKWLDLQKYGVDHLDWMLQNDYIDQALHDEAKQTMEAAKAKEAENVAHFQKAYEDFQKQLKDWYVANGQPIIKLPDWPDGDTADVVTGNNSQVGSWLSNNMMPILTPAEKSAVSNQKGSSSWQNGAGGVRTLPKTTPLDPEVIKSLASSYSADVLEKIMSGAAKTPLTKAIQVTRALGIGSFHDQFGDKLSSHDDTVDLSFLVGSVQKDFGIAEAAAGKGVTYKAGSVTMNMLIPEGFPIVWTKHISHASEYGVLLGSPAGYYVKKAEKKNGSWYLDVIVLPPEVMPYFDNFSGSAYDVPAVEGNALIEGEILPPDAFPSGVTGPGGSVGPVAAGPVA
jgi:hypothetical protein